MPALKRTTRGKKNLAFCITAIGWNEFQGWLATNIQTPFVRSLVIFFEMVQKLVAHNKQSWSWVRAGQGWVARRIDWRGITSGS